MKNNRFNDDFLYKKMTINVTELIGKFRNSRNDTTSVMTPCCLSMLSKSFNNETDLKHLTICIQIQNFKFNACHRIKVGDYYENMTELLLLL